MKSMLTPIMLSRISESGGRSSPFGVSQGSVIGAVVAVVK